MSHHDFLCVTRMGNCKPADTLLLVLTPLTGEQREPPPREKKQCHGESSMLCLRTRRRRVVSHFVSLSRERANGERTTLPLLELRTRVVQIYASVFFLLLAYKTCEVWCPAAQQQKQAAARSIISQLRRKIKIGFTHDQTIKQLLYRIKYYPAVKEKESIQQ